MRPQPIENRVERLEARMTEIERLPARMDRMEGQILLLRTEMRDEFSAVRGEMRMLNQQTITTLTERIDAVANQSRALFEEALGRIATIGEAIAGRKRPSRRRKG